MQTPVPRILLALDGRIDFLHVGRASLGNLATGLATSAGFVRRPFFTIQAARDQAGERRLTNAARSRQQNRVRDPIGPDRVSERGGDMALTRDLIEALGSPFASDDLVAQGAPLEYGRSDGCRTVFGLIWRVREALRGP